MARIVLTTIGSAGDLNPFVAAGLGLRARGHDVLFAVEDNFHPTVREAGFEVTHLTGDATTALAPYAKEMFGGSNPLVSVKTLLDHYILPTLTQKVKELRAACEGADLLVSSAFNIAGSIVADLTHIPWASLVLSPIVLPSAYIETQPLPFTLPPLLQRLNTRLTWSTGALIFRRFADAPINRIRASFGLPPRYRQLWLGGLSPRLICLACSPAFQPPAPDWPAHVHTTSFAFWDTPSSWHQTPEVNAFLAGDDPIIAVTAGSIAPGVADSFAQFYRTSISAIRAAGARALLIGIGATPDPLTSPHESDVLAIPFAPYSHI
ncbi:MAG TPA: glycosyltransferase, partial [Ktedonobacterales bacterium]